MHYAYGDESIDEKFVSYGVIAIDFDKINIAENIIIDAKTSLGAPAESRLHCRELFAGDARRKTSFSHLTTDDVFGMYEGIFRKLSSIGCRNISAVAKTSEFPKILPGGKMETVNDGIERPDVYTKSVNVTGKQIAVYCAWASMIPLSKNPGFSQVTFIPDIDNSSIEWFHGKTEQTNPLNNFYIENSTTKQPEKLNTLVIKDNKPPLLELADCIAYTSRRVMNNSMIGIGKKFMALYNAISPEEVLSGIGQDGRVRFKFE
ncbi:MAG TPA: hypothetical protein VM661_12765 [Candidatus Sulfotelmatobacter sp.]|jgi:hypothetical protein|nr:hypothetical protein [Candidatus Sulfotelmatobacter sp.]